MKYWKDGGYMSEAQYKKAVLRDYKQRLGFATDEYNMIKTKLDKLKNDIEILKKLIKEV